MVKKQKMRIASKWKSSCPSVCYRAAVETFQLGRWKERGRGRSTGMKF
jgi:hypothetical protein